MKNNLRSSYACYYPVIIIGFNKQEVDTKSEGEKLMQTSREWLKVADSKDVE
jgi:hypothetical protein